MTPFPAPRAPAPAAVSPSPHSRPPRRRRRRLVLELALYFAGLSLIPLLVAGVLNYRAAATSMREGRKENLQALVIHEAHRVGDYFDNAGDLTGLLSGSPVVRDMLSSLASVTANETAGLPANPQYQALVDEWNSRFDNFVHQLEFSQIYLINANGQLVYGDGRLGPVVMDLKSAPGSQLGLAALYETIARTRTVLPSGLTLATADHQPAFYYGAPVMDREGGTVFLGVLILELNREKLLTVLNERVGLGDTGEVSVFDRVRGANGKLRFDLINSSEMKPGDVLKPSTPLTGTETFGDGTTPPNQANVAEGVDEHGHAVLAAWSYLPSLDWVLMENMDLDEVFAPVARLRDLSLGVGAVTLVLVLVVASIVARSITRPVVQLTRVAARIAEGDLNLTVKLRACNEVGQLGDAIGTMAGNLKSLVGKVQESAAVISTNAVQMAASSRQQAEVAQTTGTAAVEVAATAKQISATSQELTRTMEEVNTVAQGTAQRAEAGLDGLQSIQTTMSELEQARVTVSDQLKLIADKTASICGITVTMTKVADQTNLLSLNAAIEARKAGEYGRGFTVVAREIQRLADQAGVATLEIEQTIEEMDTAVQAGVGGMHHFSLKVAAGLERIHTVAKQLTDVIQQVQGLPPRFEMVLQGMQSQSEGARQITSAITHMSTSAQQTAATIQEALRLLEQLRDTTRVLQNEVSLFKV